MRAAAILSAEDFALVAHDLGPCELVKGEIVPMSPGRFRHSRVTVNACALLDAHCRSRDLGRVLTGEAGVAFISYARLLKSAVHDGFLQKPPELVIEVLSRDMTWSKMDEKVTEYHTFGVDLVWVLDPQTFTLRSYPRGTTPVICRDTDTVTADPHVPGFSTRVSAFFAD